MCIVFAMIVAVAAVYLLAQLAAIAAAIAKGGQDER